MEAADRDFEFTEADFKRVQQLVGEHTGIALSDAKHDMVYSRLSRRLRARSLTDFDTYCRLIESGQDETEMVEFVNSITTNLTSFFRENHHFEFLGKELLPALMKKNAATRCIRIWSAGCSTGEEPYSIAMVVRETVPDDWDVKILATDLDTNVVNHGATGVYDEQRVDGLPAALLKRWFRRGTGGNAGKVRVAPELQSLISFRQLNLMQEWPMHGQFDVLFCRNVVIYFDKTTQQRLFDRYAERMVSDGHLFVGHSESLFKVTDRFELLGKTVYKRVK